MDSGMLTTSSVDKVPNPLVNSDYKIPKNKFLLTNLKVPKVATEVATSVIQTGTSYRGYHKGWVKENDIRGRQLERQSRKQTTRRIARGQTRYHANTPAIQRPIDRLSFIFNHYHHPTPVPYCYLNLTTVAPIRLRPTDRIIVPVRLQLADRLVDKLYA